VGDVPNCLSCWDTGHVCENHPDSPWAPMVDLLGACGCGAAMPCEACCSPVPEDGTARIGDAFTPDWMRGNPELDQRWASQADGDRMLGWTQ